MRKPSRKQVAVIAAVLVTGGVVYYLWRKRQPLELDVVEVTDVPRVTFGPTSPWSPGSGTVIPSVFQPTVTTPPPITGPILSPPPPPLVSPPPIVWSPPPVVPSPPPPTTPPWLSPPPPAIGPRPAGHSRGGTSFTTLTDLV